MNALKHTLPLFVLLASFWTAPSLAADVNAGEQKAGNCIGCHGPNGKSSSPQWPNLAAQQADYIVNQLQAFKAGTRKNSLMESTAGNMTDDDMKNLAAYFASRPPVNSGGSDPELVKKGEASAAMCLGCHGQGAEGNGQVARLAGQHYAYLLKQLRNFKSGKRENGQMQAITSGLTDSELNALAAYFSSL